MVASFEVRKSLSSSRQNLSIQLLNRGRFRLMNRDLSDNRDYESTGKFIDYGASHHYIDLNLKCRSYFRPDSTI